MSDELDPGAGVTEPACDKQVCDYGLYPGGSESCAQGFATAACHQAHPAYYSRIAVSGGTCMPRTSVWLQIIEPVMLVMLFGLPS